jgi:hypothetical protein
VITPEKADFIKSLGDDQGHIEPINVLEAARDINNILHEDFEWDDDIASEQYRIEQARRLIKFVRLPFKYGAQVVVAPYYVVDPHREPKTKRYLQTTIAARSRETVSKVMNDEFGRIVASINRARQLAAAFNQMELFDSFLSDIRQIAEKKRAESAAARKARGKKKKPRAKRRKPGRRQRPEMRT